MSKNELLTHFSHINQNHVLEKCIYLRRIKIGLVRINGHKEIKHSV